MQKLPDAAENLAGLNLDGGWMVVRKIDKDLDSTGGTFCVQYEVRHQDGRRAFCKALSLATAMMLSPNPAMALHELTDAYQFECAVLEKCANAHMSRVVLAIDKGVVTVPGFPLPNVNYIIFEWAEGDVRRALNSSTALDIAARLRCLHNIATGLQQLHRMRIAHQDMKPSNVLMFSLETDTLPSISKVADLGRATDKSMSGPDDDLRIAGDQTYAPPEQLYRSTPSDFGPRRLACDIYQLGSLMAFLFTATSINALLKYELHPTHTWHNWEGTYEEVLPYVRDAFGRAMTRIAPDIPDLVRHDLVSLIEQLCDPDPYRRGHRKEVRTTGNSYSLQRVVSRLDLLTRRAEVHLKGLIP